MTDIDVIERSLPAAAPLRRTVRPDIPQHPARLRLAGEPGKCRALPEIEPGQVWVVEHDPADLHLSWLAHRAVSAANVVIFDRALYAVVAANLPLGGYAEPASSPGKPPDMPISRCLQFARDGWSVVWLMDYRPGRRARSKQIGHLADQLIDGGYPPHLPVAVFANGGGNLLEKTEASLGLLKTVIGATYSADHRAVVFGAPGRGVAPGLYVISCNGLAG